MGGGGCRRPLFPPSLPPPPVSHSLLPPLSSTPSPPSRLRTRSLSLAPLRGNRGRREGREKDRVTGGDEEGARPNENGRRGRRGGEGKGGRKGGEGGTEGEREGGSGPAGRREAHRFGLGSGGDVEGHVPVHGGHLDLAAQDRVRVVHLGLPPRVSARACHSTACHWPALAWACQYT